MHRVASALRAHRPQALLRGEQERQVQRPIRDKPDRIKLPYALWSRQAAADRTLDQFDLRVAVRTTGACPRRWGSRQKEPMRRADQQSPAPVKRWIGTIDPDIAARARKEPAEIHWGDVAGLTAMVCADAAMLRRVTPRSRA